jgi:hypothetical protein
MRTMVEGLKRGCVTRGDEGLLHNRRQAVVIHTAGYCIWNVRSREAALRLKTGQDIKRLLLQVMNCCCAQCKDHAS